MVADAPGQCEIREQPSFVGVVAGVWFGLIVVATKPTAARIVKYEISLKSIERRRLAPRKRGLLDFSLS